MTNNIFSEELSIESVLKSYLNIDIKDETLENVLYTMAIMMVRRSRFFQPTTGQQAYYELKTKFKYLTDQVITLYSVDKLEVENKRNFFWEMVNELRSSKDDNDLMKLEFNYGIKQIKQIIDESNLNTKKANINTQEVCLYEFKDHKIAINSFAYFENDNLTIDFRKLGEIKEEEYFLTINKLEKEKIFQIFDIENDNDMLLKILKDKFNDENCFENIKSFLNYNSIEFTIKMRYDERR